MESNEDTPTSATVISVAGARFRLRSLYAALWTYSAGRRGMLIGAYALLLGAELVGLLAPWLTGRAIDHVHHGGAAALPEAGRELALVFGCIFLGWLLHAPGRILERNVALHARDRFCLTLLDRLLRAPLDWHRREPGLLRAQRVIQGSSGLHGFAESQYIYVQNTVRLVGPLVALWFLSPWVGLAACLGFGLLSTGSLLIDRIRVRLNDEHNTIARAHHALWGSLLTGMPTLLALRGGGMAQRWVVRCLALLAIPLRRSVTVNEAKWAGVDIGSNALWCGLVALYAMLATPSAAGVAMGSLYMVYEYARRAESVMKVVANDFGRMAGQLADYAAATPILAAPQLSALPEAKQSAWQVLQMRGLRWPPGYFDTDGPGELALRRGRRYALVGASGAGKSSLLRVLAGLEPLEPGVARLDGQPIDAATLREQATLVPQEVVLFDGSLRENLLLGESVMRHPSDAALVEALRSTCADEFVTWLPGGEGPTVIEGGAQWSGGQRQRLALARGLIAAKRGALVLLDEPTAALDGDTQRRVLEGLWRSLQGQCVVASLHRLELLPLFDEVIVMDRGRVVDSGPVATVSARNALVRSRAAGGGELTA